jgi:hypothetical protein
MSSATRFLCAFAFVAVCTLGGLAQFAAVRHQDSDGIPSLRPLPLFLQIEPVVPRPGYGPGEQVAFSLVFVAQIRPVGTAARWLRSHLRRAVGGPVPSESE